MYSGESLTVVVEHPNYFERYFLDLQTGQATLTPDVASSIVQGLLPSLLKASEIKSRELNLNTQSPPDVCNAISKAPIPSPGKEVQDELSVAPICMGQLAEKAIDIYQKLEPLVAPDSLTPIGAATLARPCPLQTCISEFLISEIGFSVKMAAISADVTLKKTTNATYDADSLAIGELVALQKSADLISTDLQGYKQRLLDLPTDKVALANTGVQNCSNLISVPGEKPDDKNKMQCIGITSRADIADVYHKMVTRTITYALNTYNLVSYPQEASPDPTKKKLLATIPINFADIPQRSVGSAFRWEASAGAFFSSLPVRSFSVAPVFTKGVVTDKIIVQNVLHPTVVPFAAGNYRLTNDLPWSRWKTNLYWTGAVGINPNTVTADFATGLSLSWRALMVSGLCHFGHDVRLTQGLYVGESLGAGYNGSVPTETRWTTNFALGLSIRVPSLVGR